jgi:hypothetical protein
MKFVKVAAVAAVENADHFAKQKHSESSLIRSDDSLKNMT